MVPVNMETYEMDVDLANKTPEVKPEWYKHTDFLETYEMDDLSPSSFKGMSERLYNDRDFLSKYVRHIGDSE
jgi:hypothetical protein